ncbi:hypothetical protein D3C73_1014690 [compost metagenome]
MAGAELVSGERRHRRELENWLCDPSAGICNDALAQGVEFVLRGVRPNDQSFAA